MVRFKNRYVNFHFIFVILWEQWFILFLYFIQLLFSRDCAWKKHWRTVRRLHFRSISSQGLWHSQVHFVHNRANPWRVWCSSCQQWADRYTKLHKLFVSIYDLFFGFRNIFSNFSYVLFLVKYCNEHTRVAVIRARHGPHRLVASSLPFLSKIGQKKVQVCGLHCGATMVKSFKFLQKYHQEKLNEALSSCKNQESKEKLKQILSKINYMNQDKSKEWYGPFHFS